LRNQPDCPDHVDSEVDRLVRELIRTVPQPELLSNEPAFRLHFHRVLPVSITLAPFSDAGATFLSRITAEMNSIRLLTLIAERARPNPCHGTADTQRAKVGLSVEARTGRTATSASPTN
jgi:hypothetical protein